MVKSQLKLREKRMSERRVLNGLMPGKLTINGEAIECKPINISSHGLGLLIARQFREGTVLELDMKSEQLEMEIIWVKPDFGKHDLWRYGLVCKDRKIDVEEIFEKSGCFKE